MKINTSQKFKSKNATITIKADPIEVKEIDLKPVAEAIAANVRTAVASQPSDKWDKTGTLKNGITTDGESVVAPAGRLQRDDLAHKFADEVLSNSQLTAPNVDKALAAALDKAIK